MTRLKQIGVGDWWVYTNHPDKDWATKPLTNVRQKIRCPICNKLVATMLFYKHVNGQRCRTKLAESYLLSDNYTQITNRPKKWVPLLRKVGVELKELYRHYDYLSFWAPSWVELVIDTLSTKGFLRFDAEKLFFYINNNQAAQSLLLKTQITSRPNTKLLEPKQMVSHHVLLLLNGNDNYITYLKSIKINNRTADKVIGVTSFMTWLLSLHNLITRDVYELKYYELMEFRKIVESIPDTIHKTWEIVRGDEPKPSTYNNKLYKETNKVLKLIDKEIRRWEDDFKKGTRIE